jgi:hypothetical protein
VALRCGCIGTELFMIFLTANQYLRRNQRELCAVYRGPVKLPLPPLPLHERDEAGILPEVI